MAHIGQTELYHLCGIVSDIDGMNQAYHHHSNVWNTWGFILMEIGIMKCMPWIWLHFKLDLCLTLTWSIVLLEIWVYGSSLEGKRSCPSICSEFDIWFNFIERAVRQFIQHYTVVKLCLSNDSMLTYMPKYPLKCATPWTADVNFSW